MSDKWKDISLDRQKQVTKLKHLMLARQALKLQNDMNRFKQGN